jgi:hypothetical protein
MGQGGMGQGVMTRVMARIRIGDSREFAGSFRPHAPVPVVPPTGASGFTHLLQRYCPPMRKVLDGIEPPVKDALFRNRI